MGKTPRKHFLTDAWSIIESEYSEDFSKVAESVFSLGNEYMGARGFLDEGTSYPTLRSSYLNGIYEYARDATPSAYKGIVGRTHFMVNAANLFDMTVEAGGEALDIGKSTYTDYRRVLNMKNARLERELTWHSPVGKIKLHFTRFLDMENCHRAYQAISLTAERDCTVTISFRTHFNGRHFGQESRWSMADRSELGVECATESTSQRVASVFSLSRQEDTSIFDDRALSRVVSVRLMAGVTERITRTAVCLASRAGEPCLNEAEAELSQAVREGYDAAADRCERYWTEFWRESDISIEGDEENQQGIRFCILQLAQTYHGAYPTDNIGAKGLTGEAYSGHAFWDTETYCLPYYLFNNLHAAKYLLEYRYNTLEQAKLRARDLDCLGACYPIATLNGEEACNLWQHASLQIQPTTAVAYGIYHYVNVSGDREFLNTHGAEMLVEICRFLATRGQYDNSGKHFGYYAVMGPDEFQMMVNHNTYTNLMAKKTFGFAIDTIEKMPENDRRALYERTGLCESEIELWKRLACDMKILYDEKTRLYEQHEGFYSLPHIDIHSIPDSDFPLYSHWSYDRIYRNDMIKQPDVLMFMLLYNSDFTAEQKRANYEFYEPKCIHESSLSPSVHSILANEIGRYDEALSFFSFATRMDLDDYNRNTHEGLHTTSISAAWLNIVYGFGGLRSDGEISLSPTLPKGWKSYSFRIKINKMPIKVSINAENVLVECDEDKELELKIYGERYKFKNRLVLPLGG